MGDEEVVAGAAGSRPHASAAFPLHLPSPSSFPTSPAEVERLSDAFADADADADADATALELLLAAERAEQQRLLARLAEVMRASLRLSAALPNPHPHPHPVVRRLPGGAYDADTLSAEVGRLLQDEREKATRGPTVLLGTWDSRAEYRRIITYGSGALIDLSGIEALAREHHREAEAGGLPRMTTMREERSRDSASDAAGSPAARAASPPRPALPAETDLLYSSSSPLVVTAAHVVHPQVSADGVGAAGVAGLRRCYSQPQRFYQRILVGLPLNERETAWRYEARIVPLRGTGFCQETPGQSFLDIIVLELIGELRQRATSPDPSPSPSPARPPPAPGGPLRPVRDANLMWDPSRQWDPGPLGDLPEGLEAELSLLEPEFRTTPGEPVDFFGYGQTELNPGGPLNGLTSARGSVKGGTILDEFQAEKGGGGSGSGFGGGDGGGGGGAKGRAQGGTLAVYEGRIPPHLRKASDAARAQLGYVPIYYEQPVTYRDLSRQHHLNVTITDHGHGMSGGPVCNHRNKLVAVFSCHTTFVRNMSLVHKRARPEPMQRGVSDAGAVAGAEELPPSMESLPMDRAVSAQQAQDMQPRTEDATAAAAGAEENAVPDAPLRLQVTESHGVRISAILEKLRELKRIRDGLRDGAIRSTVDLGPRDGSDGSRSDAARFPRAGWAWPGAPTAASRSPSPARRLVRQHNDVPANLIAWGDSWD